MGKVISIGIMKGGVGKTTTTAITGYLLAKTHKVLLIDMDSQGNLTSLVTKQNIYDFTKKTTLQAIQEGTVEPYIHKVSDKLHVVPAEDFLSTLPHYIWMKYRIAQPEKFRQNHHFYLLADAIAPVKDKYDYILLDLPPSPGEPTQLGLVASDFALIMLQSEPFGLDALDRYLEIIEAVQMNYKNDLKVAGILTSLLDTRTAIDASVLDQARKDYAEWVFDSVIKRKTRIKEFSINGISDHTRQDREALEMYQEFTKELVQRVRE